MSVASLSTSEMIAEEDFNFDLEYSPLREDKRDLLQDLGISLQDISNGNCISPSSELSEYPDCSRQSSFVGDDSSIDRSATSETGRSADLLLSKLSLEDYVKKTPLSSTKSGDSVLSSVPSISFHSAPQLKHCGDSRPS